MRPMILLLVVLTLACASSAHAADQDDSPQATALANAERIELGEGISMPRPVFEQLTSTPKGLEMVERMQHQASEARTFEGVPHLMVIFVSVLLFFWSAMFYYQRKHARVHRTIQLMVEKGMTVPMELLREAENSRPGTEGAVDAVVAPPWASNLLWGGLLWVTIGGVGVAYLWLRHSDAWPWGFAAIVYGLGAVLTALSKRSEKT